MNKTQLITKSAILLALYIVADLVIPDFPIIPGLNKISLSIFILPFFGLFLGGWRGFLLGCLGDVISFFLNNHGFLFNPVFVIQSGFCAAVGSILYKKTFQITRIILVAGIFAIIGIVLLNTLGLSFQYMVLAPNKELLKKILTISLTTRIITATILYFPIMIVLLYIPKKMWAYLQTK